MRGLVLPYKGKTPRIAGDVFIAPGAVVIGDVEIGPGASVWYNCVLRGDVDGIRIGARTNIQDGTVLHVDEGAPTTIGSDVTIGHMAMVHSSTLEDRAFIGILACVLEGCVVEGGAMVAAGALVTPNKRVRRGQLWAGVPAKHIRDVTADELARIAHGVEHYVEMAAAHRAGLGA
ncbi:MAG: gamma carbonic anhydrase family protein [Alphaproteobacteria bacterium]